ncbi:AaceriACR275Wp [[Ashbya] aceris (nom. inval.)]|nr:AaceriACR275Wp [[Ashbya] aceris (nom. inval.)]
MVYILELSYEIDKLRNLVDERSRLVEVLKIQPSTNDNAQLKKHLNKVLGMLRELSKDILHSRGEAFKGLVERYNDCIADIPEGLVEKGDYIYELGGMPDTGDESPPDMKRVRFQDALDVHEPQNYDERVFQPYKDDPEAELERGREELLQGRTTGGKTTHSSLTNQDLFMQQQQQLLDQDAHLEHLASSVHQSHRISTGIHREVTEQNEGILTDLESMLNNSGHRLERAKKRLAIFERTAREKGHCMLIFILIFILLLILIVF